MIRIPKSPIATFLVWLSFIALFLISYGVQNQPQLNSESSQAASINPQTNRQEISKSNLLSKNKSKNLSTKSTDSRQINSPQTDVKQIEPSLKPVQNPSPQQKPKPSEQIIIDIERVGIFSVKIKNDDTAFSTLLKAGEENNFSIDYDWYEGLGAFVKCITGICSDSSHFWAFYYNGQFSQVGASAQPVKNNDIVTWRFETW